MKKLLSLLLSGALLLCSLPVLTASAFTLPDTDIDTTPALEEYEKNITPIVYVAGQKLDPDSDIQLENGSVSFAENDGIYTLTLDNAKITSGISVNSENIYNFLNGEEVSASNETEQSYGILSNVPLQMNLIGTSSVSDVDNAMYIYPFKRGETTFTGSTDSASLTLSSNGTALYVNSEEIFSNKMINFIYSYLLGDTSESDLTFDEWFDLYSEGEALIEKLLVQKSKVTISESAQLIVDNADITCQTPLYNYGNIDINAKNLIDLMSFDNYGSATVDTPELNVESNFTMSDGTLSLSIEKSRIGEETIISGGSSVINGNFETIQFTLTGGNTEVNGNLKASSFTATDGILNVVNDEDEGSAIRVTRYFDMSGGKVTAIGSKYGVYFALKYSGNVNDFSAHSFELSGGELTAKSTSPIGTGLYLVSEEASITGGNHTFVGGNEYFSSLDITGAAGLMTLFINDIVIKDCTINTTGGIGMAIYGSDSFTIEKGTDITAQGVVAGIYGYYSNINVNGGTLAASCIGDGEHWAPIFSHDGTLTISDELTKLYGAKGTEIKSGNCSINVEDSVYGNYDISTSFMYLGTDDSVFTPTDIHFDDVNKWGFIAENVPQSVVLSDSHEHSYTEEVITSPTLFKDGVAEYTCDACGDSYQEAIEHNTGFFGKILNKLSSFVALLIKYIRIFFGKFGIDC